MKISMWGPKSSGKTTYIAMVYGTALRSKTRWIIRPHDFESTEFVSENINLIRTGTFPMQTQLMDDPLTYYYQFRPGTAEDRNENPIEDRDKFEEIVDYFRGFGVSSQHPEEKSESHKVIVEFADVAGEQYLNEPLEHKLWEHLATSDGLVCLLDPADSDDHFKIIFKLLQYLWLKLKERPDGLIDGKLPHYIAFCFSKIDQAGFAQYINKPQELIEFLENRINMNVDKMLLQYFIKKRIRYFTISAIGTEAGVEGERINHPERIAPINILKPLQWLFNISGK
jgi:hypothetical protein